MNIYSYVHDKILVAIKRLAAQEAWETLKTNNITIEIPNDTKHGDISTNAAMILAPQVKRSPIDIAKLLKKQLETDHTFLNVFFAGPGFINIVLKPNVWQKELINIIQKGSLYAKSNLGDGKRIHLDYASPNPTGPMHVGHARGAIYGDVLSSLLDYVGYKVTRECYINDAGNQMDTVAKSIYLRYLELNGKQIGKFPEGLYPGEYVIDAAKVLKKKYGDTLIDKQESEWHPMIREFAIEKMMKLIKKDLEDMGVKHDIYFYESILHKEDKIPQLIEKLQKKDLVYIGTLPPPKSKKASDWKKREQLLFRSSDYGDDLDRSLQKADGSWTYFTGDLAYLDNKVNRKFDELILIIGADHVGYKKRMQAMCKALNEGNNILDVKLCQLVTFIKNGKPLKMSKRAGNFVSVEQVLELVGKDILRFMILTRKNDVSLEFDVDQVKEQSKDNPVFYVQYAHARGCSILLNAKESANEALTNAKENPDSAKLDLLNTEAELDLIKYLCYWPKQVTLAALHHDPHRIVQYLQSLAAKFHAFWNIGKEAQNLRFIVENNVELTSARLVLVQAVLEIISSGLKLVGVIPSTRM